MIRHASLFRHMVALFNRVQLNNLASEHHAEWYKKGFNNWDHFIAMLFCLMAHDKILREISDGLSCFLEKLCHLSVKNASSKYTLSYDNVYRPWKMYRVNFYKTLDKYKVAGAGTISSNSETYWCVTGQLHHITMFNTLSLGQIPANQKSCEMHLLFEHNGYLTTYTYNSNCKKNDVNIARTVPLSTYSIVPWTGGTTTTFCLPIGMIIITISLWPGKRQDCLLCRWGAPRYSDAEYPGCFIQYIYSCQSIFDVVKQKMIFR